MEVGTQIKTQVKNDIIDKALFDLSIPGGINPKNRAEKIELLNIVVNSLNTNEQSSVRMKLALAYSNSDETKPYLNHALIPVITDFYRDHMLRIEMVSWITDSRIMEIVRDYARP